MDDKLLDIKEYMEQMQLKKVWFGGYSKEDVQIKLDMMYAMFEKLMKEQVEKEAAMLADFEKQIREMQEDFEGQKRMSDMLLVDLNKSISDLTLQNQSMEQEQRALIAENQQLVEDQANMKEAYKGYCGALLKEYSESLCSLSGEFSRILENVSNMQKEIDEERIFEGLEKAYEAKKQEVLTGDVVDTI